MSITTKLFAKLQGETITQYTLKNHQDMTVRLITFGARVQQLRLPDQTGDDPNLIAGFVTLQDYLHQPEAFGALIGPDCAHKTRADWQNWNWNAKIIDDQVVMQLTLPEGVNDLPGTQTITVTHQLDDDNQWQITLQVQSDTPMTIRPNYDLAFMLTGDPARTIDHQTLTLGTNAAPLQTQLSAETTAGLADERWTLALNTDGAGVGVSTFAHIDDTTNFNGILGHPNATVGLRPLVQPDDTPITVDATHPFRQTTTIKLLAH